MKNYNDEIDLIELFKILWKRKYIIVIPSIVIAIIFYLFSGYFITKKIKAEISTDNLNNIISYVESEKGNNDFSMLTYNKYIKPIEKQVKKDYAIMTGKVIGSPNSPLNKQLVYSIVLSKKYKENKDKEVFIGNIKDFFKRFEDLVFSEYIKSIKQSKINIENEILNIGKKIKIIEKKIAALRKYYNLDKKTFVSININNNITFVNEEEVDTKYSDNLSLSYLPPYQQFIGLSFSKDQMEISLDELKQKLQETDFLLNLFEKENKNSFHKLYSYEPLKKYQETYMNIKYIMETLDSVLENTVKNKIYFEKQASRVKYSFALFMLLIVFIAFIVLLIDLFKNKDEDR